MSKARALRGCPMNASGLKSAVEKTLDELFGMRLPAGGDSRDAQWKGTAFSIALCCRLGMGAGYSGLTMYAAPHSQKTINLLIKKNILSEKVEHHESVAITGSDRYWFTRMEYLFDIMVEEGRSARRNKKKKVRLICESEMAKQHPVPQLTDEYKENPAEGYPWDFTKLFYGTAARLLFTCMLPHRHHPLLLEHLAYWSKVYHDEWAKSDLGIILLPSSARGTMTIAIGNRNNGSLQTVCYRAILSAPDGGFLLKEYFKEDEG